MKTTMYGRLVTIAMVALLSGCGKSTPEARLQALGEDLTESTSELDALDSRIAEAEQTLADLRDRRSRLRADVRSLEQRLEDRATDVAIFRAVQTSLLEHPELQDSVISVTVDEGIVSLNGFVTDAELIHAAVSVAKSVPGVERVDTRIRVDGSTQSENGNA